jgi:hypothetical protein
MKLIKEPSPATLRSYTVTSMLTHSDNTVYVVRFAHPNVPPRLALRIHRNDGFGGEVAR